MAMDTLKYYGDLMGDESKLTPLQIYKASGAKIPEFNLDDYAFGDPRLAEYCRECFKQGLDKACLRRMGLPQNTRYIGRMPCEECEKLETEEERELCRKFNCNQENRES